MGPSVQNQIAALATQGTEVEAKNLAAHAEIRKDIAFNLQMTKYLGYLQLGTLGLVIYRILKDKK